MKIAMVSRKYGSLQGQLPIDFSVWQVSQKGWIVNVAEVTQEIIWDLLTDPGIKEDEKNAKSYDNPLLKRLPYKED
jgi:hypothetical protein